MAKADFVSLRVYQLSERLADEIREMAVRWDPFAKDAVGKQIVRAADSVGANIAEGAGRGSFPDNRRMARASLNETQHFLHRAYRRKLMTADQVSRFQPLIEELGPKLNAFLKSIGKGSRKQRTTDN